MKPKHHNHAKRRHVLAHVERLARPVPVGRAGRAWVIGYMSDAPEHAKQLAQRLAHEWTIDR